MIFSAVLCWQVALPVYPGAVEVPTIRDIQMSLINSSASHLALSRPPKIVESVSLISHLISSPALSPSRSITSAIALQRSTPARCVPSGIAQAGRRRPAAYEPASDPCSRDPRERVM